MSARISPSEETLVAKNPDGDDVYILGSDEGELRVRSRDTDNDIIIDLLSKILEQLVELTN